MICVTKTLYRGHLDRSDDVICHLYEHMKHFLFGLFGSNFAEHKLTD